MYEIQTRDEWNGQRWEVADTADTPQQAEWTMAELEGQDPRASYRIRRAPQLAVAVA
jgi:hypothetical protein